MLRKDLVKSSSEFYRLCDEVLWVKPLKHPQQFPCIVVSNYESQFDRTDLIFIYLNDFYPMLT